MNDILVMKTKGKGAPKKESAKADPSKIIRGKPATTTWNHWLGEQGRLYCGIWESSKGIVKVSYGEWEFCHLIAGEIVLTAEGKKKGVRLKKGDAFIIPPGFKGTWETVRKVKKHYVILLPKAQA
jgi:uncharacterized protein